MVEEYKNILVTVVLLGNENNYGLLDGRKLKIFPRR
jgi:hypothetical protein